MRPDVSPSRPATLPNLKAPADEVMIRSAQFMTSPATVFAAAYHGVCAAMPLDLLPRRNPIVICYCSRQPTITPSPFLPLLPAPGSTRLLCRATLPYQTTPLVGCTWLAAVRLLAECADNDACYHRGGTFRLKWFLNDGAT